MSRSVMLTDGAARDLDELYAAAYDRGGPAEADLFLDRMQGVFGGLADGSAVGVPLVELRRLGLRDALQLRFGPHRLVYRLRENEVRVALIAARARSLQSLLQRRMLDG